MSDTRNPFKIESVRQVRQLTEKEKDQVKEVWKQVEKDYLNYSTKVFKELFATHPIFKRFFLDVLGSDEDDPFTQVKFTKYMLQVLLPTLGGVIHHLDHPEAVHESMKRLGVMHKRQELGMRRENVDLLGQVLLSNLRENIENYTEEQDAAMTKVLSMALNMFNNGLEGKTG